MSNNQEIHAKLLVSHVKGFQGAPPHGCASSQIFIEVVNRKGEKQLIFS